MSQLLLDISLNHIPAFDNFVCGANQELLATLQHALQVQQGECCFYLWGEPGSGKSHLLQASAAAAVKQGLVAAYVRAQVPQYTDVMLVDDVEQLDAEQQIELFALYNQVRDEGGVLVVSGGCSPLHLQLRDDLRTRLGWGLIYQVQALTDDDKIQALMQHAQQKGWVLPVEVAQYLLRYGRRDLPSLLATLDQLDKLSLQLHRNPSIPLLKQVLQQRNKI